MVAHVQMDKALPHRAGHLGGRIARPHALLDVEDEPRAGEISAHVGEEIGAVAAQRGTFSCATVTPIRLPASQSSANRSK